jgi:hypothetical protein
MLLCDPHLSIFGATATVLSNGIIEVTQRNSASATPSAGVGNIPETAPALITGTHNYSALSTLFTPQPANQGGIKTNIWQDIFTSGMYLYSPNSTGVSPVSIDAINNNMDVYVASIAKAFSASVSGVSVGSLVGARAAEVTARTTEMRLVLAADELFWIGTITAVSTILALLLFGLVCCKNELKPLNLESITDAIGGTSDLAKRLRPASVLDFRSTWRVIWFLTFELGFVALSSYCVWHGRIGLFSSLTSLEVQTKGFFTVAFIAWQTVALFPVVGIRTYIFSSEWSYLQKASSSLVPGTTDQISVTTSGVWDQLSHAFASSSSLASRAALAALVFLIALHNFAPGGVSVSTVITNVTSSIEIGSLTAAASSNESDATGWLRHS